MSEDNCYYSSLDDIKDYFVKRTEILSACLKYRAIEDLPRRYGNLNVAVVELQVIFDELKEELKAKRENVAEMQNLLDKVENVNRRLDHMENNFPSILKKPVANQEKKTEAISNLAHKKDESHKETKTGKAIVQMQYLTLKEFDTVPKYMKGRIKYEQVNKFVDDFNSVIEKKYQLLRMPRKELKVPQMHAVQKLKAQENSETKGLFFCTNEDLKEYGNLKADKITLSIITILRHCLKVREIRSPGVIRYVVVA